MIRPKFLRAARAAVALVAGLGALDATPLLAQAAPANYTSATRYDALGRVTGTIAPDADGVAPFAFIAVRSTYDSAGNPTKVEKGVLSAWQAETIAPKDWTGFTIDSTVDSTFDAMGRKLSERVRGSDLAVVSLTQFSYTASGQVKCTAVRMNPTAFAAPPADACALGTPATVNGAAINDRITRNSYVLGDPTKLEKIEQAVGTPSQRDYVRYTYTANGKQLGVIDARGMLATYSYDGFDRLKRWTFPSKDMALSPSATDLEEYDYDLLGNLTERRLRDHTTAAPSRITYTHDALRRQTSRTPTGEHPVTYGYDLRGLLTSENRPGDGQSLAYTYDGFGRLTAEAQSYGTMTYGYDLNGNRRKITWADGLNVIYQYDQLNRVTRIRENNAGSGIGVLATYSYTPTGQRASVTYGNGTSRSYSYDTAGRTTGVKLDLAGAEHDLVIGAVAGAGTPISYNPAGQIVSLSRSNDLYAWTAHSLFERDYGVNGINQYTSAGGVTLGHDGRGNLVQSGSSTYGYSRLNELTSAPKPGGGTIPLTYDPKGRLTQVNAGTPVRMVYAGPNLVTETGQTGTVLRRYVHGPGADDPIVWYEGSGTTDRRWLQADQLGSVVAISDASGTKLGINSYDEYGIPQSGNLGRFQYTGQTWWGELGLYNYKARWYSATLGRFMQTDPIGYKDQLNLYAYVGNDPVNRVDPTGLAKCGAGFDPGGADCKQAIAAAQVAREKLLVTAAILVGMRGKPASDYSPVEKGLAAQMRSLFGDSDKGTISTIASRLTGQAEKIGATGEGVELRRADQVSSSAPIGGNHINVGHGFFSQSWRSQVGEMVHESGHTYGYKDLPVPAGDPRYQGLGATSSVGGVRFYGMDAARALANHQPNLARQNNDNYTCFVDPLGCN